MDANITAILTIIGNCLITLVGILTSNKLSNYRIEQLEKKVEKHNKVVERVYALETDEAVIKNDIKVANHRIDDLEGYHK